METRPSSLIRMISPGKTLREDVHLVHFWTAGRELGTEITSRGEEAWVHCGCSQAVLEVDDPLGSVPGLDGE